MSPKLVLAVLCLVYLALVSGLYVVYKILFGWSPQSIIGAILYLVEALLVFLFSLVFLVKFKDEVLELVSGSFLVSDSIREDNRFVWRHGVWWCGLVGYRLVGFGDIDFERISGLSNVVRVFLIKYDDYAYLLCEVHGLSKSSVLEKCDYLEKFIGCELRKAGFEVVVSEIDKCPRFKATGSDLCFEENIGGEKRLVLRPPENLLISNRCVLAVEKKSGKFFFELYSLSEGRGEKPLVLLKATKPCLSIHLDRIAEEILKKTTPYVPCKRGIVVGYRIVGKKRTLEPVFFYPRGHVVVLGMTGIGKSVLLSLLARIFEKLGYAVVVLDWYGEFLGLGRVYRVGADYGINIIEHLSLDDFLFCLVKSRENVYENPQLSFMVSEQIRRAYMSLLLEKRKLTLFELYRKLEEMSSSPELTQDKRFGAEAAARRIWDLAINPAFNYDRFSLDFRKGVHVFDLSRLSEYSKDVFVNAFLYLLYAEYAGDKIAVFIDEASRVAHTSFRGENILDMCAKRVRKFNIRLVVADQNPLALSRSVLNMAKHIFLFKVVEEENLNYVVSALKAYFNLSEDELRKEIASLIEGECFYIAHGEGAVKIKVPYIRLTSAAEVRGREYRRRLERERALLLRLHGGEAFEEKVREVAKKHGVSVEKLQAYLEKYYTLEDVEKDKHKLPVRIYRALVDLLS
ncbi:MAG: hypothetical protein DRJ52_07985 [Thermoprotei archaeon]|nr:MAG: hypothetical protein DRJ52_07985 [Thermoprotei archaeon]